VLRFHLLLILRQQQKKAQQMTSFHFGLKEMAPPGYTGVKEWINVVGGTRISGLSICSMVWQRCHGVDVMPTTGEAQLV
jgi:hypothetical protein